ncbi:MAG: LapA family protein [Mariniphaga sp.]|nr:LapA family protein [Mariniphaga sp.]
MSAVIIILLILAILLVIFTLQNSFEISISVFFWEIADVPLVLLILCCILLGYILAAVYFYPRIWKLKREYKQAVKSSKKLEEKLESQELEKPGPEGIELEIDDEDNDNGFFKE